jgi:predicted transcriptional regulator
MKLKKVKIVVETLEKTNDRWLAAMKGKTTPARSGEEVLSVSSWEVLGRILSTPRLQILTAIPALKPKSISALAKAMKKDFKNVYSDVKFLADLGLVELREEGPKKTLVPIAKFNGIELGLAA